MARRSSSLHPIAYAPSSAASGASSFSPARSNGTPGLMPACTIAYGRPDTNAYAYSGRFATQSRSSTRSPSGRAESPSIVVPAPFISQFTWFMPTSGASRYVSIRSSWLPISTVAPDSSRQMRSTPTGSGPRSIMSPSMNMRSSSAGETRSSSRSSVALCPCTSENAYVAMRAPKVSRGHLPMPGRRQDFVPSIYRV